MTEPSDDLIAEFASRFIDERDEMGIQPPEAAAPTLDEIHAKAAEDSAEDGGS